MTPFLPDRSIAKRFDAAADRYEHHAWAQRHAAEALAERIAALALPAKPRILEIGCGTGLLTRALARRLGPADWTLSDIAPDMLRQARANLNLPARYLRMDGEHPAGLDGQYDLICSSLAVQWFGDLNAGLARLTRWLRPGGHLAIATLAQESFKEWHQAHAVLSLKAATPEYPPVADIRAGLLPGRVDSEQHVQSHHSGLAFLRGLKGIGATAPRAGHQPLNTAQLRAVLRQFDRQGACVTYQFAYGQWRKPRGVFVTGTDTGVGKTLVSALLTRAWQADYWKPLQTGLAEESGDSATVAALARLPPERLHAPAYALQAPLAPWAAASLENTCIDATRLTLPETAAPLVVEGAGGLYVPIDERSLIIDLIDNLGLPVVLAARSGLGTINHTLLSLEALRARKLPVLGVIMSGPPSDDNRRAIEHFGRIPVLAQIPQLDVVDAQAVDLWSRQIPTLDSLLSSNASR
ncbi:dethiobiotin synthase [Bordetella avium]|uniref:dethiobiotin synthase n=1 Tax=Bordetella avium TaxID=521 RepID=UPI000E0A510C|nr:dethiobiotin synthase [Bordetella avium]AZY53165.1 dethiobiotin synthase [Bordetella avium]RIQ12490.1 dethiobiotin synthase [Bordetella avium]RIQ17581.1 dethiobiotin synthase [Bordetella avium]RIQ32238.1 dethiobiotin synthase [Bordetella avium]RIQ37273.1 dethiobiotin synthase [Bordetella avium]